MLDAMNHYSGDPYPFMPEKGPTTPALAGTTSYPRPAKEPGVKKDPAGPVDRKLLAMYPGTPICREAQAYVAKMKVEGQPFAIKLLRNFDSPEDQVREIRQLMGYPRVIKPPKKLTKKEQAAKAAFEDEYAVRLPELERMAARNRADRAIKANAQVISQYTQQHDNWLPVNEALALHERAPALEPAMKMAVLEAVRLTNPQANGVFIVEVDRGVAQGCWQIRPNLKPMTFWERVKLAVRLAFGLGIVPLPKAEQKRNAITPEDLDSALKELEKDLDAEFKKAAAERKEAANG